jgi:hypothetical protein
VADLRHMLRCCSHGVLPELNCAYLEGILRATDDLPSPEEITKKVGALFSRPTYFLPCGMRRRCRGCQTVKRVNSAWLGNTAAMMHYLRIVNSRGRQWAEG